MGSRLHGALAGVVIVTGFAAIRRSACPVERDAVSSSGQAWS